MGLGCSKEKVIEKIEDDEDDDYLSTCKTKYNILKESDVNISSKISADASIGTYKNVCKSTYGLDEPVSFVGYLDNGSNLADVFQRFINDGRKTYCDSSNINSLKLIINEFIDKLNSNGTVYESMDDVKTKLDSLIASEDELFQIMADALVDDSIVKLNTSGAVEFDKEAYKTALGCSDDIEGDVKEELFTVMPDDDDDVAGGELYTIKGDKSNNKKKFQIKYIDIAIFIMLIVVISLIRNKK